MVKTMKILVINSGSSSLKYQLFRMEDQSVLAKGLCECIGFGGKITHKVPGKEDFKEELPLPTHDEALKEVFALLIDNNKGVLKNMNEIDAVGHRVAHGGERFNKSSPVTEDMIDYLESIVPINPLHGPAALKGIKACLKLLPSTPQTATFDTSFYAEFEPYRYIYGLPYECYEKYGVRRYGFHGTSHRYVTQSVANILNKPLKELKIITCHLGNGSSITATMNGKAIDTTMGFTPQEGILMGTRSGDIDPTIIPFLMNNYGYTPDQMSDVLNKKSGLLGVSGVSNDCRDVEDAAEQGNKRAQLALDILYDGIKKYIGSYAAIMNGLDVLVFTAGIGENSYKTRENVCKNLEFLGIEIDESLNKNFKRGIPFNITGKNSKVQVWIVPTNEELMIALDTQNIVKGE